MAGLLNLFGGGSGHDTNKPFYSVDHLQHLYNRLQTTKKETDEQSAHMRNSMVEVIRQITEALIWGEQNDHDHKLFDFFCEKNILADFVQVLGLPRIPKIVKVQLLQTLSMLVQNIRRDTSLYYLFSNNYVNQLISTQLDWSDEEILGYYISFLKSLALRLNGETIKFFFNELAQQFPLYVEAVRFFAHRDQMVRTTVRTLTLQVYKIQDEAMRKFVLEQSSWAYFKHLACHLRELWSQLDAATQAAPNNPSSSVALQELNEQLQDLLMYLSDVMELEVPQLGELLAEQLLSYALLPAVLGALSRGTSPTRRPGAVDTAIGNLTPRASPHPSPTVLAPPPESLGISTWEAAQENASTCRPLSLECALFILHQVLDTFRSPAIVEPLLEILLSPAAPVALTDLCLSPLPEPPPTYQAISSDVSGPPSTETLGPPPDGDGKHAWIVTEPLRVGTARQVETSRCIRDGLLECLHSPSDIAVLLAAGIVQSCLRHRREAESVEDQAWALKMPTRSAGVEEDEDTHANSPSEQGGNYLAKVETSHANHSEMLLAVCKACENQKQLRLVALHLVIGCTLCLATDLLERGSGLLEKPSRAVRHAMRTAALDVHGYLHGSLGDGFLDLFSEEWELYAVPYLDVREVCANIRCLLPATLSLPPPGSSLDWSLPQPHSERQHAAKAMRGLMALRWLQEELSKKGHGAGVNGEDPDDGVSSAQSPLHVPEEVAEGYQEGRAFELGRQDRIVCGIVSSEGRLTRYLVLHPFLLLLVQPDLVSPGWAVVRTLCPVRFVECQIDGNDPRMLRLSIRLTKGVVVPGEANALTEGFGVQEECRGSSLHVLALGFEDTKRCHCAHQHLRKRRQEVRAQVRNSVEAFISGLCS